MSHRKILGTLFLGSALLLTVSCNTNRGFKAAQGIGGECVPGSEGCVDPLEDGKELSEEFKQKMAEVDKRIEIYLDLATQFKESDNENVAAFGLEFEKLQQSLKEQGIEDREKIKLAYEELFSSEGLQNSEGGAHDLEAPVSLTEENGQLNFVERVDSDEVITASVSVAEAVSTANSAEIISIVDGEPENKVVTDLQVIMICMDGVETCKQVSVSLTDENGVQRNMLFVKTEAGFLPIDFKDQNALGVPSELGPGEYEKSIQQKLGMAEPVATRHSQVYGQSADLVPVGTQEPVATRHSQVYGQSADLSPVGGAQKPVATRHSQVYGQSADLKPVKVPGNSKKSNISPEDRAFGKDGNNSQELKLADFSEFIDVNQPSLAHHRDILVKRSDVDQMRKELNYDGFVQDGTMTMRRANFLSLMSYLVREHQLVKKD